MVLQLHVTMKDYLVPEPSAQTVVAKKAKTTSAGKQTTKLTTL
jgi:hypothetical protein